MSEEVQTQPFKATLKAGSEYAAPWLTVQASTAAELEALLDSLTESALQKVNDVASLFHSARVVSQPDAPPATNSAPSVSAPAQSAELKTCAHGKREYKSGEKNGKTWAGWFCPQPKNASDKCQPIWKD